MVGRRRGRAAEEAHLKAETQPTGEEKQKHPGGETWLNAGAEVAEAARLKGEEEASEAVRLNMEEEENQKEACLKAGTGAEDAARLGATSCACLCMTCTFGFRHRDFVLEWRVAGPTNALATGMQATASCLSPRHATILP